MSNKIFVKAVKGRTIFVPGTADVVPENGIEVEDNSFWQRRLTDGDVAISTKPKSTAPGADKDK